MEDATAISNGSNPHPSSEPPTTRSDLVAIHREALSRLFSTPTKQKRDAETEGLQRQLDTLKRRRISLASEMECFSVKETSTTVTEEIERGPQHCPPPFVRSYVNANDSPRNKEPSNNDYNIHRSLLRMHTIRNKRRIVGSHRLAGISVVYPRDDNVIGIRIDICVNGRYVGRHVAFFQMILVDDLPEQFRLVQHTLPMIAVTEKLKTEPVVGFGALRATIGELYDTCYGYAMRKEACLWLQQNATNDNKFGSILIQDLVFSEAYDAVALRLQQRGQTVPRRGGAASKESIQVRLSYTNPQVARPTRIQVHRVSTTRRRSREGESSNDAVPEVSDEDEGDEAFEGIKSAFLSFPVPRAIEEITRILEHND